MIYVITQIGVYEVENKTLPLISWLQDQFHRGMKLTEVINNLHLLNNGKKLHCIEIVSSTELTHIVTILEENGGGCDS